MATDANGNIIFHGGHGAGLKNVGSYQVSGHPFATGSSTLGNLEQQMIEFPYVSKSFTVINKTDNMTLRVHFMSGTNTTNAVNVTEPGGSTVYAIAEADNVIAGRHYIGLTGDGASMTFDTKCSKFYVSTATADDITYEVFAELTSIGTASMYHLTGSGITDTAG
jgi:hypothetical protein